MVIEMKIAYGMAAVHVHFFVELENVSLSFHHHRYM